MVTGGFASGQTPQRVPYDLARIMTDTFPPDLAAAEATLRTNLGQLRQRSTPNSAAQVAAVAAVEWVIMTATQQHAGWGKLKLIALRELGLFLLRTPYLKGRPPKVSTADTLPSLEKLGIKDRRIAWRAIQVARVDEDFFDAYLTTDEPTEKGLLRNALSESVPQDDPLHREAHRPTEDYSESGNVAGRRREFDRRTQFLTATGKKYLAFHATSASQEWYTPEHIFIALGCRFDVDVASPGEHVTHWIPADRVFTIADNGLEQDWGEAFAWMNCPHGPELPRWLEKFREHGNGVCLVVDRTSTKWWQDLCSNADLILQLNKKIQFLRPDTEEGDYPVNNNALGSSLVAYGERGVEALINAAEQGLGTLYKPVVPTSEFFDDDDEETEKPRKRPFGDAQGHQYWNTPPESYEEWNAKWGPFDYDAFPADRPEGYDSLEEAWGFKTYANGPFSASRNPEGIGPSKVSRKAIAENKLGKRIFLPLPVNSHTHLLLSADAEMVPLGRVPWVDQITGKRQPNPPFIAAFILWEQGQSPSARLQRATELLKKLVEGAG
jgi:hypothetical protein